MAVYHFDLIFLPKGYYDSLPDISFFSTLRDVLARCFRLVLILKTEEGFKYPRIKIFSTCNKFQLEYLSMNCLILYIIGPGRIFCYANLVPYYRIFQTCIYYHGLLHQIKED